METSLSSIDIEKEINFVLKDIQQRDQQFVIGYFRQTALDKFQLNVPLSIINYCIAYLYAIIEKFDHSTNFSGVTIEQEGLKIRHDDGGWYNIFGTARISMTKKTYQWGLESHSKSGLNNHWFVIGLAPAQDIDDYDRATSHKWILSHDHMKAFGLHLGNGYMFPNGYTGDISEGFEYFDISGLFRGKTVVSMIFDTNKRTLRYEISDENRDEKVHAKREFAKDNIDERDYKLAMSMSGSSNVILKSFDCYK